jgi:hypothetical protein
MARMEGIECCTTSFRSRFKWCKICDTRICTWIIKCAYEGMNGNTFAVIFIINIIIYNINIYKEKYYYYYYYYYYY